MFFAPVKSAICFDDGDELLSSLNDLSRSSVVSHDTISELSVIQDGTEQLQGRDSVFLVESDDYQLSYPVKNVVNYIGGYIVRKLKGQIQCSQCLSHLTSNSDVVEEDQLLTHFKAYSYNKSGFGALFCPSVTLSRYLQRIEKNSRLR